MTTDFGGRFDADVKQVTPHKLVWLPLVAGYAIAMYGMLGLESGWATLVGFANA